MIYKKGSYILLHTIFPEHWFYYCFVDINIEYILQITMRHRLLGSLSDEDLSGLWITCRHVISLQTGFRIRHRKGNGSSWHWWHKRTILIYDKEKENFHFSVKRKKFVRLHFTISVSKFPRLVYWQDKTEMIFIVDSMTRDMFSAIRSSLKWNDDIRLTPTEKK